MQRTDTRDTDLPCRTLERVETPEHQVQRRPQVRDGGPHVAARCVCPSGGKSELSFSKGIERSEKNVLQSSIWECDLSTCQSMNSP